MSNKPFPWTSPLPDLGQLRQPGCGCEAMRSTRVLIQEFGPDTPQYWGKIPRTFGAKWVVIGPQSEWDSCVLEGTALGPVVVSVGSPCLVPLDQDITIRPWRSYGGNQEGPRCRLDLLVLDKIPPWGLDKRGPRIYPDLESDALSSASETLLSLNTEFQNGVARAVNGAVSSNQRRMVNVSGAKSFNLYLRNAEASDISWRVVGVRLDGNDEYPISPNGYASASPTYNTLTAGHKEAWHYDVSIDNFDAIAVFAKAVAAGTITLFHGAMVAD